MNDPKVRFEIEIPLLPVPKHRPRIGRTRFGHGCLIKDPRTLAAEEQIRAFLSTKVVPFYAGPIEIWAEFRIPRPKTVKRRWPTARPDLDNYLKLLMDSLNGVLYGDDCQVVVQYLRKTYCDPGENGRILFAAESCLVTEPAKWFRTLDK
jgi:Holliday junction resolvase RusA-like endonuclease